MYQNPTIVSILFSTLICHCWFPKMSRFCSHTHFSCCSKYFRSFTTAHPRKWRWPCSTPPPQPPHLDSVSPYCQDLKFGLSAYVQLCLSFSKIAPVYFSKDTAMAFFNISSSSPSSFSEFPSGWLRAT